VQIDLRQRSVKETIMTPFHRDWRTLVIGGMSMLVMTAVAAISSNDVNFAVALGAFGSAAYVATMRVGWIVHEAKTVTPVILGGVGVFLGLLAIGAVGESSISGHFTMMPIRPSWWALPIGGAIGTALHAWKVARSRPDA
jgi:hypothetical protein